jgi:hypothetical protein
VGDGNDRKLCRAGNLRTLAVEKLRKERRAYDAEKQHAITLHETTMLLRSNMRRRVNKTPSGPISRFC